MSYLWFKALHVAAVIAWMGGLFVLSVTYARLVAIPGPRDAATQAMIATVRLWDGRVTAPAMALTWAIGILLAVQGGLFSAPWLSAKLLFVLLLSALHGVLSGRLRRLGDDAGQTPPAAFRHAGVFVLAAVLVIAILVVVKPF